MELLFFELVQVAICRRDSLSRVPSAEEWSMLYGLAVKQAVAGVCFYGVQRLPKEQIVEMPVQLKMQWLAITSQIQWQNEVMNIRCAELSRRLKESGFACCLLKGQGVARLYDFNDNVNLNDKLGLYRQCGDIDMWVKAEPEKVIAWARMTGKLKSFDYHHADVRLFPDVEVELHYRPSISRNLVRNARMQRWFKESGSEHIVYDEALDCNVPDWTFNVVLCLNHIFCHLLFEGVGLRQLMDFYFVLKASPLPSPEREGVITLIRRFRLMRFASAVMWVLENTFELESKYLLCDPDEKAGRFLLEEILRAGNFGHYDERLKGARTGGRMRLFGRWMKHSMRLIRHYPIDVLWTPVGILWISMWRRIRIGD